MEHLVDQRVTGFDQGCPPDESPRVIDQHVDAAKVPMHLCGQPFDLRSVRHIGAEHRAAATGGLHTGQDGVSLLRVRMAMHGDAGALRCEIYSRCGTDPRTRTGDQHHLVLQIIHT